MRNEEWVNTADAEAEITRLKDGRTALAYKTEQAVGMETGAILAVTTHGGATGDTDSIGETVAEAGIAVAEQALQRTVNQAGIEEVVADKGYHSNEVMRTLAEWNCAATLPSRNVARGSGKAKGRTSGGVCEWTADLRSARQAFTSRARGTGGAEFCTSVRYWMAGPAVCERRGDKKLLIQAAACNLALLMLILYGAASRGS
jgi:hypothetical protein